MSVHVRLHARARRFAARVAVRRWEYRQRDLAMGVWPKLRRLLAYSERALAVDDAELQALVAEGVALDPVGAALEPQLRIAVVSADRAARLASATPLPLRLGEPLLRSKNLVLVRFPGAPI